MELLDRLNPPTSVFALGLLAFIAIIAAIRFVPHVSAWFAQRAFSRAEDESPASSSVSEPPMQLLALRNSPVLGCALLAAAMVLLGFCKGGIALACACATWGLVASALLDADVRFGCLPLELNVSFLLIGSFVQGALDGRGLLFGSATGTLLACASLFAYLWGARHGKQLIGGGDIVAIFACCAGTGFGCLIGAFACCASALVVEGARLVVARRKIEAPTTPNKENEEDDDGFPMAPYLMVWLLVGFAA